MACRPSLTWQVTWYVMFHRKEILHNRPHSLHLKWGHYNMDLYMEVTWWSHYCCELSVIWFVSLLKEKLKIVWTSSDQAKTFYRPIFTTAVSYSQIWCWISSHQKLIASCLLLSPTPALKQQSCRTAAGLNKSTRWASVCWSGCWILKKAGHKNH